MPGSISYATLATGHIGHSRMGSLNPLFDMESSILWDSKYNYQSRSIKSLKDKNKWVSLWPRMKFGNADQYAECVWSQDYGSKLEPYEPFSCDGEGTQTLRFINGICKDSTSTIVANATVQAFRTSDDLYVGQDVSREDGTYNCGVATVAGVQHYLVAYKAGSPDITGATVNTLTSTNVDGT